jgi:hypothetical protein
MRVGRGPLEGAESGVGLAAQSIGSGFSDRRYSPGSFMVTSPAPWILADLRVVGSRRSNSLEIGKNPVTGRPLPCLLHYLVNGPPATRFMEPNRHCARIPKGTDLSLTKMSQGTFDHRGMEKERNIGQNRLVDKRQVISKLRQYRDD